MERIKDILIGIIIGATLFTIPIFAQSAVSSISVRLNAINVQLEGHPVEVNSILYQGSTYLPMRKVAELVGKDVEWEPETMTANIIDHKKESIITNDSKIKIINGEEYYSIRDAIDLINARKTGNNDYAQYSIWPSGKIEQGDFILILSLFKGKLGREEIRLIDNVPYIIYQGGSHIKKAYYEQTILPLIQ